MKEYVLKSWQENRDTLADGQKSTARAAIEIYAFITAVAVIASIITERPSSDLLSGTLTAFAIVTGFTFSALLFFVDHKFGVQIDPDSREQKEKQNKIDELSDQLFVNINYFNLLCLLLISTCLFGLMAPRLEVFVGSEIADDYSVALGTELVGRFIFYFLIAEALYTFYRLLARLRYLFEKVRAAHKASR